MVIICIFVFAGEKIIPESSDQRFLDDIVSEFNTRVL
jgi:hypothetical protein